MALTPPPAPPSTSDPANFDPRADALLAWLPAMTTELGALQSDVAAKQGTATTAASTASTKAGEASTSANTAAAQVPLATTQANAASASAVTAAQRLTDILALYDMFDDRYLGSKDADPLVDNDNNALQNGVFYINSVSGQLRAYTTTGGWVQSVSATAGVTALNSLTGNLTLKTVGGVTLLGTGDVATLPAQAGNAGKFVTTNGTSAAWAVPNLLLRSPRTANFALTATDHGALIDITSGTFMQTFDAAAGLGNGWFCYLRNSGTGDITLDPNLSEVIDGLASYVMYPGECRLVQCDGVALRSIVLTSFSCTFSASGIFKKPPGYSIFGGLVWGAGSGGGKNSTVGAASGGGGGACYPFSLATSLFSATETVTVGAGGNGATADGSSGNAGGNTSVGAVIISYGGNGAGGGGVLSGSRPFNSATQRSNEGFGGAGVTYDSAYGGAGGGQGGTLALGGSSWYGGAGGGGGPSTTTGVGGTSIHGGNGGAGMNAAAGISGSVPAGGGGATNTGSSGGAGARGEVRIWGII